MTPTASSSSSSSSSLFILISTISLLFTTTTSFQSLLTICSGDNYTLTSPYATNLRRLLSNLTTTTPNSPTHLFTNNLASNSTPDAVFGIAECRQDATPANCAACLSDSAAAGFNRTCAHRKSVTIRYDYCLLRYDDHPFYSYPQNFSFAHEFKAERAVKPTGFREQVGKMLDELAAAAPVGSPKFAVMKIKYSFAMEAEREMYGLAWCTMLSPEKCYECLNQGLQGYMECCSDQIGGWVATASCVVAYDDKPIFNISLLEIEGPLPGGGEDIVTGIDP